jgi:hypothetical protein
MIVVVDNSPSMVEEQQVLATGFFTLLNALVDPTGGLEAADDVRGGIVTSDLGTQSSREPGPAIDEQNTPKGDDGEFRTYSPGTTVRVTSGVIPCDEDGSQCPTAEWTCQGGVCQAPSGTMGDVSCPGIGSSYAEVLPGQTNAQLALQTACLGQVGQDGCGYEQQLEASVLGLEKHPDFMRADYLLAVLVVSDEEDCSVKNAGLWTSDSFLDQDLNNVSCNYPPSNEQNFLFPTNEYAQRLRALKKDENAVVFAAIVGVPKDDESGCQGKGSEIDDCLDSPAMQLDVKIDGFTDERGKKYTHFATACIRDDDQNVPGMETEARPGRRYVQVAQDFGDNGYIYSICNPDWSPAMKDFADSIRQKLEPSCYASALDWDPASRVARCDVVMQLEDGKTVDDCPPALADAWIEATGKTLADYRAVAMASSNKRKDGTLIAGCPLPKIPTPLQCDEAEKDLSSLQKEVGWYYCENGVLIDGKACDYKVEITGSTKQLVIGHSLEVQCLQQFSFEDVNCQETGAAACRNGKDDDGNGAYDCWNDFEGENPHRADAHCCPLALEENESGRVCRILLQDVVHMCGETTPGGEPLSATAYPDACDRAAAEQGCALAFE